MDGAWSRTSVMRLAQMMARGSIMAMKVPIMTAARICMRYWRKAVSEPTSTSPSSTRWPPNQSTAPVATLRITVMMGNIVTNRLPILSESCVMSSLASVKRSVSWASRTKARTTRMPVICSRSVPLMASSLSCMTRKSGMSLAMSAEMTPRSTATETHTSQERPASSRMAMMMPPMAIIGADTMKFMVIMNVIWTCWTSFVPRVMSVGVPK